MSGRQFVMSKNILCPSVVLQLFVQIFRGGYYPPQAAVARLPYEFTVLAYCWLNYPRKLQIITNGYNLQKYN